MTAAVPTPILVVEDDGNTLTGYMEFLASAGFNPTGVPDATSALPIALRNPPDVVVTDITLPGMSGFELAAALRADERTKHVPVIGLTADVKMQAILLKPCIPSHLVAELERVLGRTCRSAV